MMAATHTHTKGDKMRCPDCERFVSYDTEQEPEEQSAEISDELFSGEYMRTLTCADCGTELKQAEISIEVDLELDPIACPKGDGEEECDWDLSGLDVEPTERVQDTDRHGRRIKSARYMRRYYGVEISGDAKCERCDRTVEISGENDEQASGFDELT